MDCWISGRLLVEHPPLSRLPPVHVAQVSVAGAAWREVVRGLRENGSVVLVVGGRCLGSSRMEMAASGDRGCRVVELWHCRGDATYARSCWYQLRNSPRGVQGGIIRALS